jgi:3-phosphoshikimate 1-carboxyvinyltransferase
VLFAALADGVSRLSGVLDSQDVRATIRAVTDLGAKVDLQPAQDGTLFGSVEGWGSSGPREPAGAIDCGNSGTTARLILGVLAGWPITVTLIGDESLSRRPMKRVTEPLTAMGASFELSGAGTLPVTVHGQSVLSPFAYDSPVASAQVKTAVLLAGLRARGGVRVTEPAPSRDHTELLLPTFGASVSVDRSTRSASLCGPQQLHAADVTVPGDPSSAAFLVAAALLVRDSEIELPGVSLNPTRTGFLAVLARMGADVTVAEEPSAGAERIGTIVARYTPELKATVVRPVEVATLVDEVPVLALVASQASGTTRFDGVGELRVKESDRLAAVAQALSEFGVDSSTGPDWLEVEGPARLRGASLDSLHDHRLAMCWALAGLIAETPVTVRDFSAVDVSYPSFADDLARLASF